MSIQLFKDGMMNMTLENMKLDNKIKINHQVSASNLPEIHKTVIFGTTASFYDTNDKLLDTQTIEMPKNTELVDNLLQLGEEYSTEDINALITNMQGQRYIENLDKFIEDSVKNGAQILQQDENFVTLRMSFNKIDLKLDRETVLLIDKKIQRLVGTRVYNSQNELLQSTLLGYTNDEKKELQGIRLVETVKVPSGKLIKKTTTTLIDNLEYKLNL